MILNGLIEFKDNVVNGADKAKQTYDSTAQSLSTIAKFFNDVSWIFGHPYESFKIFMTGLSNVAMVTSYIIIAVSLMLMILEYKGGVKYAKISFVIFIILKMVAVAL